MNDNFVNHSYHYVPYGYNREISWFGMPSILLETCLCCRAAKLWGPAGSAIDDDISGKVRREKNWPRGCSLPALYHDTCFTETHKSESVNVSAAVREAEGGEGD